MTRLHAHAPDVLTLVVRRPAEGAYGYVVTSHTVLVVGAKRGSPLAKAATVLAGLHGRIAEQDELTFGLLDESKPGRPIPCQLVIRDVQQDVDRGCWATPRWRRR